MTWLTEVNVFSFSPQRSLSSEVTHSVTYSFVLGFSRVTVHRISLSLSLLSLSVYSFIYCPLIHPFGLSDRSSSLVMAE